ncbi:MAG: hypothetical protein OXI87_15010 [Albidovulum sp.]|nr:hypothetical protein [Albidovulum sp.]
MAKSKMGAQDDSSDVLSLDSTYKSYELEDVDALFLNMRRAIEEKGERTPDDAPAVLRH